jgi:hypothetical protein
MTRFATKLGAASQSFNFFETGFMSRKSSFLNFELFPALPFENFEGVGACRVTS